MVNIHHRNFNVKDGLRSHEASTAENEVKNFEKSESYHEILDDLANHPLRSGQKVQSWHPGLCLRLQYAQLEGEDAVDNVQRV